MKILFKPKFYLGEIRLIYFVRLYRKALRVGAGEALLRQADTLIHFAEWERDLAGREFDTADGEQLMATPEFPPSLRDASLPLVERAFVAECIRAANGYELDWSMYFQDAESTVESLQEELELLE